MPMKTGASKVCIPFPVVPGTEAFSALNEAIKADHGFNVESKAIRDLIEIMATYDTAGRRDFLQFITGSPRLPIGGEYLYTLTIP